MRLTQLSALLALPPTLLAFVIFPDAEVFRSSLNLSPKSMSSPKHIEDVEADEVRLSPKYAGAPISHDEHEGELRLSPKIAYLSHLLEETIEDEWVRITKLSPKHISHIKANDDSDDDPLPVIIWHGLGDSADNKGLKEVAELVDKVHPGTYTYIISVGGSGSADRQASFFGNVTDQLDNVAHVLAKDNILRTAPAVDAIGFSQGGQFLRGYVERYGSWAPKIRSLITFGSQHNGIAEFQKCASSTDWICQGANALLKSSTVWSNFVQSRLVPAQYYRDTKDLDNYLEHSNFLADINNERKQKNISYAVNIAALEKFVMVMFKDDKTVIPKESGWFAEVNFEDESVTKLRDRPIYKEDWIGLKALDEKGGLDFLSLPGEHMELDEKDLTKLFTTYFGPVGKKFEDAGVDETPEGKVEL